jgi:hypothetical protein
MKQLSNNLHNDIKTLLQNARNKVYATINSTMTETYWQIGKRIVEEEQSGEYRAKYGKGLLKNLSIALSEEFGKGFSVDNLENMRKFYLTYPKSETASRKFKLSWSHYIFLTRITDEDEHKTIGIILCKDKSESLVKLTLPEKNNQIYASKYLTVLPKKEELKKLLEEIPDDINDESVE